ncbi:MAG: hypothetical protein AAF741_03950 [Bacteroidota bacterium]
MKYLIKYFLLALLMCMSTVYVSAEHTEPYVEVIDISIDTIGPRMEKVRQARQAFLTQEMGLTEAEAGAFFPVFWEREAERRKMVREAREQRLRSTEEDQSDEDLALQRLERLSEMQSKRAEIEDRYQDRFLKVIPPTKLLKLEPAERAFRRKLLERVRQRRARRGGRG